MPKANSRVALMMAYVAIMSSTTILAVDTPKEGNHEDLLKWAVKKFGSKEAAAKDASLQGWRHFSKDDLETAATRFRQALSLNPNSPDAHWGLGAVLARQGSLSDSIESLERASSLAPANLDISLDLAVQYAERGRRLMKSKKTRSIGEDDLKRSSDIFAKIEPSMDSKPNFHMQHAILLYYMSSFDKSWKAVSKAEFLGAKPQGRFLKALSAKMPRPESQDRKQ